MKTGHFNLPTTRLELVWSWWWVRVLPPRLAPVLRLALALPLVLVLESPSPALAVAFPARPHSATRTSRS